VAVLSSATLDFAEAKTVKIRIQSAIPSKAVLHGPITGPANIRQPCCLVRQLLAPTLKTMNRSGYDVRLSAGTITAGGTLGILIPPSIMLVVMGPVLEVPVTDLFAAAIVPGFLLAFL